MRHFDPQILPYSRNYIYDGWRVIQERDNSNNPQVSYTRGLDLSGTLEGAGGIGGLLARSSGYASGNWTSHAYYHADGNGNITCLLDTNQTRVAYYRYNDPYGYSVTASGALASANVYRFSSKEIHINSGYYYYGHRFYDPGTQRWINRDPLQDLGSVNAIAPDLARLVAWLGVAVPPVEAIDGANLYCFAGNSTVGAIDIFGLKTKGKYSFKLCTKLFKLGKRKCRLCAGLEIPQKRPPDWPPAGGEPVPYVAPSTDRSETGAMASRRRDHNGIAVGVWLECPTPTDCEK